MWALFSLAFKSFTSNPLRGIVLAAAVALGVAGFGAVQLTNDAIGRGVERVWYATVGAAHLSARSFSISGFPNTAVSAVENLPSVATVAPTTRKWVFFRTGELRGFIELIGVEPEAERRIRGYRVTQGRFLSSDSTGVVLRASWAQEHGIRSGDSMELITRDGFRTFQVAGLLSDDEAGIASYGSVVLVPLNLARQAFGMDDRVDSIAILLRDERVAPEAQASLPQVLPAPLLLTTAAQTRAALERSVAQLEANLALFGALALFVAIFLIFNTVEMAATSQMKQTGRLRAVGATRSQVFLYFLAVGLIPGAVGSIVGALLGYALAAALGSWVGQVQQVSAAPIAFSAPVTAISILVGLLTVAVAALSPALRAARANPLDLVQAEDSEVRAQSTWTLEAIGLALVILSLLLVIRWPTLGADRFPRVFVLLPLIVGLVFVSRIVIRAMSRLLRTTFQRVGGAASRLAAENLSRHATRTGLTVAGFSVSLSLMIALVAVGVGSTHAGERWTRALIPGDYAVVSPVDQPPVFIGQFAELPDIQQVSPVSFVRTQSRGAPIQLASVEPQLYARGLEYVEGSPEQTERALATGGAVIVPRRLAADRGLHPGGDLEIETDAGPQTLRVAAVVATSFPSPSGSGSAMISRADGERLFANRTFRILNLTFQPGTLPQAARETAGEMAERYGMALVAPEEIAEEVASALFRIFALFGALVGVAFVIATLGTANTMLMNIAERSRELSILWAAGMSRRQLQRMAAMEAVLMGLMGGILGTAIGAGLARVLIVLWASGDFQPEYTFPVGAALVGILLAMVASSLAALAPARAASRLDVNL